MLIQGAFFRLGGGPIGLGPRWHPIMQTTYPQNKLHWVSQIKPLGTSLVQSKPGRTPKIWFCQVGWKFCKLAQHLFPQGRRDAPISSFVLHRRCKVALCKFYSTPNTMKHTVPNTIITNYDNIENNAKVQPAGLVLRSLILQRCKPAASFLCIQVLLNTKYNQQ